MKAIKFCIIQLNGRYGPYKKVIKPGTKITTKHDKDIEVQEVWGTWMNNSRLKNIWIVVTKDRLVSPSEIVYAKNNDLPTWTVEFHNKTTGELS